MRVSMVAVLLAALAVAPAGAKAFDPGDKQGGFIGAKRKTLGDDYYVVREANDKCSLKKGDWGSPPEGAVGKAPYADTGSAKKAMKTLPECKGGEVEEDEAASGRHKKK